MGFHVVLDPFDFHYMKKKKKKDILQHIIFLFPQKKVSLVRNSVHF